MSWFKKAIGLAKKVGKFVLETNPATAPFAKDIEQKASELPAFAKLTGSMVHAGIVNVEENIARGFRKITKTGGRPVFQPTEGPLVSTVSLQDLAALSQQAYESDGGSREGYSTITTKTLKDLQFSIYQNNEDGHVVVAFRGSVNQDNWLKRNMFIKPEDDGFGNKVHSGFKSAWDDLKPEVDSELHKLFGSNEFGNNVTFTGHSLGGAISQLATADYMGRQNPQLIDTVTFASPTVGDAGFNERIAGGHMMRVVDPRDSVPKIVQMLSPEFVEPGSSTRVIALGDKDDRANEAVKRDAVRFGLELSFDVGIALLLAYAPEAEEGLAAEEGIEGAVSGASGAEGKGLAELEAEALAAVEEAVGVGAGAEEAALEETFIEMIGGEGETISSSELSDIRNLFNPEFRAQVSASLKEITAESISENIVRIGNSIDWEATVKAVLIKKGITTAAQNLILPFVTENVTGEMDAEGVKFVMDNSFDFMYGAARAHPVGQYVKNVENQFGGQEDNARADMWDNYHKNLKKEGKEEELIEFMTEDELKQYMEDFHHDDLEGGVTAGGDGEPGGDGSGGGGEEREGREGEREGEEDEETEETQQTEIHNLAGIESTSVNGRPLHPFPSRTGRKQDGSTVFSVLTEEGQTLSYNGPSHPGSSTTMYGKWTGVAPFANDLPVKVNRSSGLGGQAFSALDTFSMAYLINSYQDGYHNSQADSMYQKRIKAAIENGFISDSVDQDEFRVANIILRQFKEKGHLFGAEDESITSRGNMLSEIELMSRGDLLDATEGVNGVAVQFSRGEKRKLSRAFATPEGNAIGREVMERSSKRLATENVTGINVVENSMKTIDFNLRALRALGMENSVEYAVLNDGVKKASNAYMTALNLENELSDFMMETKVSVEGVLTNPLAGNVTRDNLREENINISGNGEYLKDKLTLEILKIVL